MRIHRKHSLHCLVLIFSMLPIVVYADASQLYPFHTQQRTEQFYRLTHQLRCLVCQNENIADSQAGFAKDIRHQVYSMVKQGKTDKQIKQYLVNRYGNFILYKPVISSVTLLLWLTPLILLLMGGYILYQVINRKRKQ